MSQCQGLKQEWLSESQFSCWISGIPGDEFVYCKLCQKYVNLYNGRSSLRKHAQGIKHSDLEKSFKRKRNRPSKAKSKVPVVPSPGSLKTSQTAGVNINFINAPNTSTVPDVHPTISTLDRNKKKNVFSRGVRPREKKRRRDANDCMVWLDDQLVQFEQRIDEMVDSWDTMTAEDISDFLAHYNGSLSSLKYSRIRSILDNYETSAEDLRRKTKEKLIHAFLEYSY